MKLVILNSLTTAAHMHCLSTNAHRNLYLWVSICLCLNECMCVPLCVYSFVPPPRREGVFSYLWPLQDQGWHAITKTALSITLTDRLKRGFNSYSSPWALHHRGGYPSTPLLSPFIVSACQSLRASAKWPLLLRRSAPVLSLILWLWVRGTAMAGTALSSNWGVD